uniref:Uncharacterized protein n=1 Tax=Triticum urartu TaxID=4572 RepID=A0A8R7Q2Z6_TRIUA
DACARSQIRSSPPPTLLIGGAPVGVEHHRRCPAPCFPGVFTARSSSEPGSLLQRLARTPRDPASTTPPQALCDPPSSLPEPKMLSITSHLLALARPPPRPCWLFPSRTRSR